MKLTGKVVYQDLEGGFWGIVSDSGQRFRPIHMPEQLKLPGAKVRVEVKHLSNQDDIFMWGEVVEIISFSTLSC